MVRLQPQASLTIMPGLAIDPHLGTRQSSHSFDRVAAVEGIRELQSSVRWSREGSCVSAKHMFQRYASSSVASCPQCRVDPYDNLARHIWLSQQRCWNGTIGGLTAHLLFQLSLQMALPSRCNDPIRLAPKFVVIKGCLTCETMPAEMVLPH